MTDDERNMRLAIAEAIKAYNAGDVPIGAVLVDESGILVCANHNRIEELDDATAHAEILVLREACRKLGRRLSGCTLYSTIEPCPMCAGALVLSRVERLVYGAVNSKFGAAESVFNVVNNPALNHRLKITAGVLENECHKIMRNFFMKLK